MSRSSSSSPAPPPDDDLELPGYGPAALLTQGGYSHIYRVHQPQFDRSVAVKVLAFALTDYKAQRRFQRECRLAGRLSAHPNIVTVHDAGIAPDGRPYITMEYFPAGSIADRIHREGPFKVSDALRIGIACAGALETAHRAGVIHRDVKPANVLLTSYGQPALADFGLSVLAERQAVTTTADALTPYHAPPEMLERSAATTRSDVYSLASTVYTMLAGRAPHQGADDDRSPAPTVGELLLSILQQDVPPIDRPGIPQSLQVALSEGLARDPSERTPTALAFARALQEVQLQLGYEVTDPVVIDVDTGASPAGDGPGETGAASRSVSRSPSPWPSPGGSPPPSPPRGAGQRTDPRDLVIGVDVDQGADGPAADATVTRSGTGRGPERDRGGDLRDPGDDRGGPGGVEGRGWGTAADRDDDPDRFGDGTGWGGGGLGRGAGADLDDDRDLDDFWGRDGGGGRFGFGRGRDSLADVGGTTVERAAAFAPLPKPLTRLDDRRSRQSWKVPAVAAGVVLAGFLALLALRSVGASGSDDAGDEVPEREAAPSSSRGGVEPGPPSGAGDEPESVPGPDPGTVQPDDLTATESEAGVQLTWSGDPDAEHVVLILSETEAPALHPPVEGLSDLVTAPELDPDDGYCFAVARQDAIDVDAADGVINPAFTDPTCIRGASQNTIQPT